MPSKGVLSARLFNLIYG
ncbi:hypothetical protein [Escherichia coli]|nr:hypothetical protein [Escherichia coli]MED6347251.1 protein YchT [Escherichia coli O157]MBV2413186.1 protein YchT [Escherichia coli]MBV2465610.1 protein YchT [Escherichia coli]MBY8613415.1 protein YchT [Escherichia coli]MBY8776442.1 protein YchT [Escherichia coli]